MYARAAAIALLALPRLASIVTLCANPVVAIHFIEDLDRCPWYNSKT